MEDHHESSMSS